MTSAPYTIPPLCHHTHAELRPVAHPDRHDKDTKNTNKSTHPSSGNPSEAPDKNLQATEQHEKKTADVTHSE